MEGLYKMIKYLILFFAHPSLVFAEYDKHFMTQYPASTGIIQMKV